VTDLSALIARAVELKRGNREFALFWYGTDGYQYDGGQWSAQIGNTSQFVSIGESEPEFDGAGATAEEAVIALIEVLEAAAQGKAHEPNPQD
jgi:hypothetical protein